MSIRNESLGKLRRYERLPNGLQLEAVNGTLRLLVYNSGTVRVTAVKAGQMIDDFSYAVAARPDQEPDFEVNDERFTIVLSTEEMVVYVLKNPLRLKFCDLDGRTVNEDDPAFGISWIGEQPTCYKSLQENERFLGLGEKTGPLDRSGRAYVNWNTDKLAYPVDHDPLYATLPFYIGAHNQRSYGIFFDNTRKTTFNFGASNNRFSYFSAEGGQLDYFYFAGDVSQIVERYTALTGRPSLPPMWALGYHQCRYSYYPQHEIESVARNFRERGIPADGVFFDIHYMDEFKAFSWDKSRFPEPKKLIADLKEQGFHLTIILDPGIKTEEGYVPYESGLEADIFVKYPDGTVYEGEVWPGWCAFPDFTKPEGREWWAETCRSVIEDGVEGLWIDMNEPAAWGQHLPDLIEFDFDGNGATHKAARNVYAQQMARSTHEGAKKHLEGNRPFLLTRAAYSGSQRYTAIWTGDNVSSDRHMLEGVQLLNSLGLTGYAFSGYDVGGFFGECSPALYARWVAIGAFTPFMRGHTIVNSRDHEPWSFGEEVEDVARNYLKLRYRLLPYLYSAFYEHIQNGTPIVRSLAYGFTHDEMIYEEDFQYQYLFGPNLMVAPCDSVQQITKVYLPAGNWYDFYTDQHFEGPRTVYAETPLERIPLFAKGGGMLVMQSDVQHTGQQNDGALSVHLYDGYDTGAFVYYEDDGSSYAYESGDYLKRTFTFYPQSKTLEIGETEGKFMSKFNKIRVYFHGFGTLASRVQVNGVGMGVSEVEERYCAPISTFDPENKALRDPYGSLTLPSVEFAHIRGQITLQW